VSERLTAFLPLPDFPRTLCAVPVETGKEKFFAELEALIAEAKRLQIQVLTSKSRKRRPVIN
jgi:hypothetical protein